MRKLTAGLFHAIDGTVESPNLWQFDAFDDDLGVLLTGVIDNTETVLMGRKGYEEWAGYWPTAQQDEGFAAFINSVPKFVASRSLKGPLAWQNSTVIDSDFEPFVRDLKHGSGRDISIMGGFSLVRQLLFAGLLDELILITHPVVAGAGQRRLFEPGDPTTRLRLLSSNRTSKGNVVSTYGPVV